MAAVEAADRATALRSTPGLSSAVEFTDLRGQRHFTRTEAILSMREVVTHGTGETNVMILLDNRETFRVAGDIAVLAKLVFG
jgi:hypothetical protein